MIKDSPGDDACFNTQILSFSLLFYLFLFMLEPKTKLILNLIKKGENMFDCNLICKFNSYVLDFLKTIFLYFLGVAFLFNENFDELILQFIFFMF